VGPTNHVRDGGQNRTTLFAAVRGDKSAMRPLAESLWTLVVIVIVIVIINIIIM